MSEAAQDIDLSREALAAANVNPATGLATDYLNVFNEALMLIALVADAPDTLEELADWRPITYAEHFARSGFEFRDVALAAYRAADPELRQAFDAAAHELGADVDAAITELAALRDLGDPLEVVAQSRSAELQAAVTRLSAMIHGGFEDSSSQDAIDALFE